MQPDDTKVTIINTHFVKIQNSTSTGTITKWQSYQQVIGFQVGNNQPIAKQTIYFTTIVDDKPVTKRSAVSTRDRGKISPAPRLVSEEDFNKLWAIQTGQVSPDAPSISPNSPHKGK